MKADVLCIDDDAPRSRGRRKTLEDAGYVVLHAGNESQAVELLDAHGASVVCVESHCANVGGNAIGSGVKRAQPRVPVILIQDKWAAPDKFEEYVDVVIEESDFEATAPWLIEELRDSSYPYFVPWFEHWKRRSSQVFTVQPLPVC